MSIEEASLVVRPERRAHFLREAARLEARARACGASSTELSIALGVLGVLHGLVREPEAAP